MEATNSQPYQDTPASGSSEPSYAPFPWFGGKRRVAAEVWQRFGNVANYVEPFFGSGAVLFGRPRGFQGIETVNDLDGYVANFWRSIKLSPEATAELANNPVNENDLHARHVWLVQQRETLRSRLEGDPDWHDPKIAGWWAWGVSTWIGGGFCDGKGPWWVDNDRRLVRAKGRSQGVQRRLIFLAPNRGVNGQRELAPWFESLANRLANVRVASGDWSRVCTPAVTFAYGITGVFLDPPYADTANREAGVYREDSESVAHDVRKWAIANGDNRLLRIALCGYEGEHEMPASWSVYSWKAGAPHGSKNGTKERIWFSPACLQSAQASLFDFVKPQSVE